MTDWELWDPGWTYVERIWVEGVAVDVNEIPNVRFVDSANVDNACAAGADRCRVRWNKIESRFGSEMSFHIYSFPIYRVFLFALLGQDPAVDTARCGTRLLHLPDEDTTRSSNQTAVTEGAMDLSTPANLPAGCRVEKWVASVVPEVQRHIGGGVTLYKHSGAALEFRDP